MFNKELILQNNDAQIRINLKKSPKARRLILRIRPDKAIELVVPKRTSEKSALRFLNLHKEWLINKLSHIKPTARKTLANGSIISILGKEYKIEHSGNLRGVTRLNDNILSVSGDVGVINKKVKDFLVKEAKNEISKMAKSLAPQMGVQYKNITLRDTSSRWGSCSAKGNLSFCWRLVFAPYEVVKYVVIHELAHLREMNHSERFWAIVEKVDGNYKAHRRWLRNNGAKLQGYE